MLIQKKIIKNTKMLIFLISIVISSCAVNDKEPFDIINEAKKLFNNIAGDSEDIIFEEKENEIKEKKKSEVLLSDKTSQTNIIKNNNKKETDKVNTTKKKSEEIKNLEDKIKEEENISESKLIKKKLKIEKNQTENNYEVIMNKEKKIYTDQIKVGVLLPLTGENKSIGTAILNALELALFQTDSKKINLIIKDTKADPIITKNIFKNLINENIKIFIGPLYASSLSSIQNEVTSKNVDLFALTNNTNLAKKGIWTFGIDPQQQTITILDFLLEKGNTKIGFLLPENAYGYLLYDTIQKVLSKENIVPVRVEFFKESIDSQRKAAKKISLGFEEYENYLNSIEEKINTENVDENIALTEVLEKPLDSIFIAASGQTLTILASQLQYSNVDPKKVIYAGTSSWEDESILQEPALNRSFFSATTDFLQEEITKTYSIAYGTNMPRVAMVAYDILSLLSSVIKEKGDLKVSYLLNENGYLGLRGLFRLKPNGIVERTFQIKTIKKSQFKTFQKAPEFFKN